MTWIVTIDDLERVVSLQFRWVHPGGGWWTDPIRDLFVWAWPGHSLCCKLGIDPARYFACHQSSTCFMEARSCLSHTERLLPSGFPDFKYLEVYFSFLAWIEVGQDYVAVGRAQWFGSCGFGYPWCLGHIRATPLRLGFHERRLACSKHAGRTFNVSLDAHSMAAAAEGFPRQDMHSPDQFQHEDGGCFECACFYQTIRVHVGLLGHLIHAEVLVCARNCCLYQVPRQRQACNETCELGEAGDYLFLVHLGSCSNRYNHSALALASCRRQLRSILLGSGRHHDACHNCLPLQSCWLFQMELPTDWTRQEAATEFLLW